MAGSTARRYGNEVESWENDTWVLRSDNHSREEAAAKFAEHIGRDVAACAIREETVRYGKPPEEFGMEFERGYYTPAKSGRGSFRMWEYYDGQLRSQITD